MQGQHLPSSGTQQQVSNGTDCSPETVLWVRARRTVPLEVPSDLLTEACLVTKRGKRNSTSVLKHWAVAHCSVLKASDYLLSLGNGKKCGLISGFKMWQTKVFSGQEMENFCSFHFNSQLDLNPGLKSSYSEIIRWKWGCSTRVCKCEIEDTF